jgi:hypothetical protein
MTPLANLSGRSVPILMGAVLGHRQLSNTLTMQMVSSLNASWHGDGSVGQCAWANFTEVSRTTQTLDGNGRVIRSSVGSGGVTYALSDYLYDSLGRPSCSIQYMNPATWGTQATSCLPLQTSGPNGRTVSHRPATMPMGVDGDRRRRHRSGQRNAPTPIIPMAHWPMLLMRTTTRPAIPMMALIA